MNSSFTDFSPLVSIALTTFNGGQLLKEQLDSILVQTYQNYEVVISDDGSEPDTVAILNEYCAKDKRFRWSRSPLERGFRKNTENAILLCKGEIIILCDQDDIWFENKIQSHVDAYRDPSIMWAFNRCVLTDSDGNETGYIEDTLSDYYRHKTVLENTWGTCIGAAQTSYRTDLLKSVMPVPDYCPAHDSWIQLAIYPAKPFFIDKVTNTYRQHQNNMVGFSTRDDLIALKTREKEAIEENMKYLKLLSGNGVLSFKKRSFLLMVYYAKLIRGWWRKFVGIGI
ncbi:MAG: glycosyltransferase [Candidatus Paceibacterota bacterium]